MLYGTQTTLALENFPISGQRIPPELIHALGHVKWSAAKVNQDLERFAQPGPLGLSDPQVEALLAACREVWDGKLDDQFPVDLYQTGSGTSSNMNANEVIANRANRIVAERGGEVTKTIHANDHVNLGQSSNDIFPTAIHVALAGQIDRQLIPSLLNSQQVLAEKAALWHDVFKIGRTHLADATPMTLGQEFGGLARQMELAGERATRAVAAIWELPVGGTAIGSGINTHRDFGSRVARELANVTGIPFTEASNHFEANAARDGLVECHGQLRAIAVTLFDVANKIRWLAAGPRCAFYEIRLPELQAGSSIMPGKVNPVMCESLMQVAARVMGNDQTIAFCGAAGGQFQLNVMMPVMGCAALESVRLMAAGTQAFSDRALKRMEANRENCRAFIEKSLSLAAALVPAIGYDRAAEIAEEAFRTGKTIREVAGHVIAEQELAKLLDLPRITTPE
ncbi:MAG: class II fumarate hydratase [Pirellulaceae bacterium]